MQIVETFRGIAIRFHKTLGLYHAQIGKVSISARKLEQVRSNVSLYV